ncbi:hypothetical protein [Spongiactinospora sp. TRM90649]|uniref:hypothetical protein n=1 Tax=Spongiactinospora sp. TRM90649 TaxID=3031114 RepID=UPI0023F8E8B8|nr:hypothetical protein [Spongiactinospora sp. TRM90649]MDF5757348.1 hypothetical protein [Spongiactinospora sp. TRM90649]
MTIASASPTAEAHVDNRRPKLNFQPQSFLVAGLVATAVIVAAILIGDAPTVLAPIVGAAFAIPVSLGIGAFVRARIVLTTHEIVLRGIFFERRRSRSDAAEVVRATLTAPRGSPGETLFVLDAHRDPLIRLPVGGYARKDVDRLVSALGLPCGGPDHAVDANELARTYPGLVSWTELHPYRIAWRWRRPRSATTIQRCWPPGRGGRVGAVVFTTGGVIASRIATRAPLRHPHRRLLRRHRAGHHPQPRDHPGTGRPTAHRLGRHGACRRPGHPGELDGRKLRRGGTGRHHRRARLRPLRRVILAYLLFATGYITLPAGG